MPCSVVNVSSNISTFIGRNVCLVFNCWDTPLNIMSFESRKLSFDVMQCGIIPCLFFVGAPANILSMIVFYRQGLRDRMNLCLFSLAFADLMFGTSLFVMVLHCFVTIFTPDEENYFITTIAQYSLNFVTGFGYSSGFLTMIISMERCMCVMFPMKAATLISTKTMGVILTLSVLLIQFLCGVYIVKETTIHVKDEASGKSRFVLSNTEVYLSHSIFNIIENFFLSLLFFLNFSVVIVATTLTVVSLRSAASWRKVVASGSSYLKGQAVLIKMLVVVSCIYILCTAPNVALSLARFTVPEFRTDGAYCNVFIVTHMIAFVIILFNSTGNFFVYITMSSRFRQELKLLSVPQSTGKLK